MSVTAAQELEVGGDLYRGMKIGRYEVLTQLSVGGMAELFLGYTAGPGGFRKYVVIKKILPDARDNEQFVRMFLDEARITAAFSHPKIGQVFELGQDDKELFLAMEFIAGQNLNQVVGACARKRAVLPIGFSASVAHDLAQALHYAHIFTTPDGQSLPVIHRDVAQKNVMVTYDGVVKLLDFGIAKARGSLGRTHVGTVKGTTGYMSPEQVRGESLDGRSDVFSLGVVLFEMVTGQRLFAADTEIDEMKAILHQPIPQPHDLVPVVPEALSHVVMRALAREKSDRFGSAKEMARAMQASCSNLLFDQEQRASFMREHFDEKMKATQALLQSAGTVVERDSQVVQAAVKALTEEPGIQSNAPRMAKGAARKARARPKKKHDTDEQLMLMNMAKQPSSAVVSEPAPKSGLLVPLITLIIVVGLGAVVFRVVFGSNTLPPEAIEAQKRLGQPGSTGPVPIPGEPGVPQETPPGLPGPIPEFGDRAAVVPKAVERPVEAGNQTAVGDDDKKKPKAPSVSKGTFTLITFPSATVFRGKTQLGKTPLFNAELPIGTHVLTLVGPDGDRHMLSMPVTSGKPQPIKVKLDELPTR